MEVFSGGRWFRLQSECEDFSRYQIPEWNFQWSIDIVSYLQFVRGDPVATMGSQRDEVHAANFKKVKEQSIVISAFKNDTPLILGGLGEGK